MVRLITLVIVPWSSPWASAGTWRDMMLRNAGVARPIKDQGTIQANIIQPSVAKAKPRKPMPPRIKPR